MAEGILKSLIPDEWRGKIEVRSAGTAAHEGEEPAAFAREVAGARGVSLEGIRSSHLDRRLAQEADLIVVMERRQRGVVLSLDPGADGKTILLTDLLPPGDPGRGLDLRDPFGGPREGYEETFAFLERVLREGWAEIEKRLLRTE